MRKPTRLQTPRQPASRHGAARPPGPRHLRRLAAILLTSGSLLLAGLVLPATAPLASAASWGGMESRHGAAATLQIHGGPGLTYGATGLPAALTISASGLISGTERAAGTRTVTVTGESAAGAFTTITFIWTVS